MPRLEAERDLLARREDVWAFLAEPYHLADWWPGLSGVEPDRRGLAEGARWRVQVGAWNPLTGWRPPQPQTLLVDSVEPPERVAFTFLRDRLRADLRLAAAREHTHASLLVEARWRFGFRHSLARLALYRLYELVQTAATL